MSTGVDIQYKFDSLYCFYTNIFEANFVAEEIGFRFGNLNSNPVLLKFLSDMCKSYLVCKSPTSDFFQVSEKLSKIFSVYKLL